MKQPPAGFDARPVRKIGKTHRAITGSLASAKTPTGAIYESALERDFYLSLDFDPGVLRFIPQPVTIPLKGLGTRHRQYTPDVLVHYVDTRPSGLFEVKYLSEVQDTPDVFRVRFQAARTYARTQGWTFTLMTERTIRVPSLKNVQFLRPFAARSVPEQDVHDLLGTLRTLGHTTPEDLLAAFPTRRLSLLPALWHLVAIRRIETNLSLALTVKSIIWSGRRSAP